MMVLMRVLNGLFESQPRELSRPTQITLPKGQVMPLSLRRTHRTIHVVAGDAWITAKGQDFVLFCGQDVLLPLDRKGILISTRMAKELVFEIRPNVE